MNKFKACSILCALCLIFNVIFPTLTSVVYAENSGECNITLDFGNDATLENGAVYYGTASIKLCYIDENNPKQYVPITNKTNTPINVREHSYFLEIDGDNVELRVKGMLESIPGDKLYGLHSNSFAGNGEVVTVELQQNNQPGGPEGPGEPQNECNITLDFGNDATLNNGKTYYSNDTYIELCYDDGNNGDGTKKYRVVDILDKQNTQINLAEPHQYRLHVVGDNVDLMIDGTPVNNMPGDKYYGLNASEFNNNAVVMVSLQPQNNGQPGEPGEPSEPQEGKVILGGAEIIDITDENKLEYIETGVEFIYNEEERIVVATLEDNKTLDNIEVIGDIDLKIIFKGQNSKILSDNNDISIKVPRRVMLETAPYDSNDVNAIIPKLTLEGGIIGYTIIENQTKPGDIIISTGGVDGGLLLNESNLTIGSEDAYSSNGIVNVPENDGDNTGILVLPGATLTVFSDNTIASGRNAEEDIYIVALNGGKIIGNCNGTAFEDIDFVGVSNGSEIDIESTTAIGEFDSLARYYGWQNNIASSVSEEDVVVNVECSVGNHPDDRYILTKTNTEYNLKSIAGQVHPICASTNPADFGEDAVVRNGTFEIIAGNGFNSSGWGADGITEFRLEAGTEVTIRLLPDYGYQFKNGSINGLDIVPDEGSATYTFIMPDNPLHISAIFEKVDDKIVVDENSQIKNASISGLEGQFRGNAQFAVRPEQDLSAFDEYVNNGSKIATGLDLKVDQMILKAGTDDEYWIENITELEREMDITLELDDNIDLKDKEIFVLREHNGEITKIPANYDEATNKVSFKTGEFSTYAIAFEENIEDNTINNKVKTNNPTTGDNIVMYSTVFVVALLGITTFSKLNKKNKKIKSKH